MEEKDNKIAQLSKSIEIFKDPNNKLSKQQEVKIDEKLGDYINNLSSKSKMNFIFLRENEGMYQFGAKRVYLKINRGSIFVRVGGGFIDFE